MSLVRPWTTVSTASSGDFRGHPCSRAWSLPVPAGMTPSGVPVPVTADSARWIMPSPPTTTSASTPPATASAASCADSDASRPTSSRTCTSWWWKRASARRPAATALPCPAAGFVSSATCFIIRGPRRIAERCRRRNSFGDQLARVEDAGRVEDGLHRAQDLDADRTHLGGHPTAVDSADSVMVRDGSPVRHEHIVHCGLDAAPLLNGLALLRADDGEVEGRAGVIHVRDVAEDERHRAG